LDIAERRSWTTDRTDYHGCRSPDRSVPILEIRGEGSIPVKLLFARPFPSLAPE
jgi:hypothetical protein